MDIQELAKYVAESSAETVTKEGDTVTLEFADKTTFQYDEKAAAQAIAPSVDALLAFISRSVKGNIILTIILDRERNTVKMRLDADGEQRWGRGNNEQEALLTAAYELMQVRTEKKQVEDPKLETGLEEVAVAK